MSIVTDVGPFTDTPPARRTASSARAGQIAGPLFLVVSALQLPLNPGFDLTRHAFSFLTLGPHGWIQQANFVVLGVLNLVASGALRSALGGRRGTTAAVLLSFVGLGQIIAGLFTPPPSFGYPVGAPAGVPDDVGISGILHGVGFGLSMTAWIVLLVVIAIALHRADRGWARACLGCAIALAVVPVVSGQPYATVTLYLVVSTAFVFTSALLARLHTRKS